MASVRKIKGELHKAIGSVIEDCFLYLYLFPESETELLAIIDDAVLLEENSIKGFNAMPETKEMRRGYYTRLKSEVRNQNIVLYERLCKISDNQK